MCYSNRAVTFPIDTELGYFRHRVLILFGRHKEMWWGRFFEGCMPMCFDLSHRSMVFGQLHMAHWQRKVRPYKGAARLLR